MKKVLFISYSFFDYEKRIIELMEKNLGYEVYYINPEKLRQGYSGIFERMHNALILKPFFRTSIKEKKLYNNLKREVEKISEFDYIFCIRPDMMNHEIMKYLKSFNKSMIVHHWDSFSFIPTQKEYLKYFDYKSTFDKKESEEYKMKFIPNFYIEEYIKKNLEIEYDIFTVMKYDNRFKKIEAIAKSLKEKNINYKIVVVTNENIKSDYVEIQKEKISLDKTYELISKSKAVLEIGHIDKARYQGGLSFRVADVIGNKKKLITNYEIVKTYDFYCEENVQIISDLNLDIDKKFFNEKYKELDLEVYEEYSGKNWIKEIFKGD